MRFVLAYAAAHAHPHCSLSVAFRPVCPRPPNTFLHWLHVGLDISLLSMSGRLPVALARRSLWFREMRGLPDAVFPLPSCRPVPRVGTSCSHGTARQSRKACGNLRDLGRRCCNFPVLYLHSRCLRGGPRVSLRVWRPIDLSNPAPKRRND